MRATVTTVTIATLRCLRCGHVWVPNVPSPLTCAKCRSPYWDKPRQKRAKKARTA